VVIEFAISVTLILTIEIADLTGPSRDPIPVEILVI
jgi:hypothetical protein